MLSIDLKSIKDNMSTPFTYYTIIGRDSNLLEHHLDNITNYAGFNSLECKKRLLVIIYKNSNILESTTDKIIEICAKYKAGYSIYEEPSSNFLKNLYYCWNLGYTHALDGYIFRGGSDQIFSKDSFLELYSVAEQNKDKKIVLQANTIENQHATVSSRHILAPFGGTYEDFNYQKFETLCLELNNAPLVENIDLIDVQTALKAWGHPTSFHSTLGNIDRCDGCSWLMTKKEWEEYGPLPELENNVTGDVVIHDRMQLDGYTMYIVKKCLTYHFIRGESKGFTQT